MEIIAACFAEFDISVTCVSSEENIGKDLQAPDYLIASPQVIDKLGLKAPSTYSVVISQMGDFEADTLIEHEFAQEVLMRPVSSSVIRDLIIRLVDGNPRGKALLSNSTEAADKIRSFVGLDVLIADDSAVNREVIVQALRTLEIYPDVVENGLQALSHAKFKQYDLILMDGSMPEMDGFTSARLIREDESARRAKPVPIVALTAHVAGDAAGAWKECGMNARVLKPFTMEALTNCIAEWCDSVQVPESNTIIPDPEQAETVSTEQSGIDSIDQVEPILDPAVLNSLREIAGDLGDDMLERLFTIYRENAPTALYNLNEMCAGDDLIKIGAAAHALKSMSGNIAATRLASACERLEQQASAGESQNVETLCEKNWSGVFVGYRRVSNPWTNP